MTHFLARLLATRWVVVFVAACLLTFAAEHFVEMAIGHNDSVSRSIFDARQMYSRLVASWPRELKPRHSVLMTIDTTPIPQGGAGLRDPAAVDSREICRQRRRTAELMLQLEKLEPAIIVIDKFYGARRCEEQPEDTRALQQAFARVSSRIPIVVGLLIDVPPGTKPEDVEVLPLLEPLNFPDAARLRQGIVNLDLDTRRAPLGWKVVSASQPVPQWRNTIALEAALAREPGLLKSNAKLRDLVADRAHPYISMIGVAGFQWFRVGDAFCTPGQMPAEFSGWCAARNPPLEQIRGRTVIIGEMNAPEDMHQTVLGRVPGVLLQANYIEALLDDRYFQPAPVWVDLLIGFFFFVAVELSLTARTWWQALSWVALSIVITFVMLALVVRLIGYYVNPITFSSLVLGVNLVIWLREKILKMAGGNHA